LTPPVFPPLSEPSGWGRIRETIERGGVLAIPLEYSWCLAQSPFAAWAQGTSRFGQDAQLAGVPLKPSLYELKKRSETKPFLYMAGSLAEIAPFSFIPRSPWAKVWVDSWPAFLTLILPAKPLAVSLGMSRHGGVAFRIPRDLVLRSFLSYLKTPITGTSLNISGSPPLVSMEEISEVFPGLDGIVSSGDKNAAKISPIIDLSKGMPGFVRPAQGLFTVRDFRHAAM